MKISQSHKEHEEQFLFFIYEYLKKKSIYRGFEKIGAILDLTGYRGYLQVT